MQSIDESTLDSSTPEMADMLPDEIRQMLELRKEKRLQDIQTIGSTIAKKRDEAVKGRSATGIEETWQEDQDSYEGVDDANRGDVKAYKPSGPSGSFVPMRRSDSTRSTVFLNITRPYVDAAAARVADMLMPTDDKNWAIKTTPIPELNKIANALRKDGVVAPSAAANQMQLAFYKQQEAAAKKIEAEAKERAARAEKRIEDWLVQCQWHAEMRKVMEDCARLGTGIMKGPTPAKRKATKYTDGKLEMMITIEPESRRIDPWCFYPDPACGEDIHNGSYVFEKDTISVRQLRDLKGTPGYLEENIDKVIEEGPNKSLLTTLRSSDSKSENDDARFEIWYYYGVLDKKDIELLGVDTEGVNMEGVPAIVTLVNDTAIKAALNPLDSGDFPYDVIPWQRAAGQWTGTGVSRQIRTPQRMVNAATRNLMDNAGLSGGPMLIIRRGLVEPADGTWNLTPRKVFYVKEEADVRTVADAVTPIVIPSMQVELNGIIQFALKMAEDVTGLPQLMQGSMGNKAPDTVGGMQMLQNNASTVLRRIARTFDDCITEPHITRYYSWLMTYGDDEDKGDFQIDARGSSALVERDIANQAILQMAAIVMNPAFGIDPEKWFAESCKAQRLDPKRFQMDEEKKAQMAQMQPPPPPQLAVAQIRAESDMKKTQMQIEAEMKIAQMESQVDQMRIQKDTDRDTVYVQSEQQRAAAEHDARMRELDMKLQLAQLDYASKHQIKLEEVKAKLAETAMKLNVQKDLAGASHMVDVHKHNNPQVIKPAVEPAGRAPAGQAFTQ